MSSGEFTKESGAELKKLFVAGVSWNTTDDAFFNFFAGFGAIEEASVIREPGGRSRGFGFVSFKDNAHADKVLSQQVQLDGRKLDIKVAVPKSEMAQQQASGAAAPTTKLWVAGISYDTTDDALFNYFARWGEVERACVMKDKISGRSRGFGFVSYKEMSSIEDVLSQSDMELDGRKLDIKPAAPRGSGMLRHSQLESSFAPRDGSRGGGNSGGLVRKLFVAGLLATTTEETFRKYFGQYGTVTDAVIQKDKLSGESRGFGFVTFESVEATKKVLQFSGHSIDSHGVDCKIAIAKPSYGGAQGGGFRGAPGGADAYGNPAFADPYRNAMAAQASAVAAYGRAAQGNPYAMAAMGMGMGNFAGAGGAGAYGAGAGAGAGPGGYGGQAAGGQVGYNAQGAGNSRQGAPAAGNAQVQQSQGLQPGGGVQGQGGYGGYGGQADAGYGAAYDNAYDQGVGAGANVGVGGVGGGAAAYSAYSGRNSRSQRVGASYHPYR